MNNLISTHNLSKKYLTDDVETTALFEIDFRLQEGEFVAIMGESGCGKSTLLNIVGLLDKPSQGEYHFMGKRVDHLSEKARTEIRKQHIGFIFQSFNLIDELTVFENVALPLVYQKMAKAERRQRVNQLLEKIGIAHRAKHFPQQLSGGQQQRVAVARAIVNQPSLLLADEPTGNLDSFHGNEVMSLLTQLNNSGTTILMVTHSEHDAAFAHRTVRLLDGQILSENQTETTKTF